MNKTQVNLKSFMKRLTNRVDQEEDRLSELEIKEVEQLNKDKAKIL